MAVNQIPMWGGGSVTKGASAAPSGPSQPVQNPLGVMQMAGDVGGGGGAMGGEGGAQSTPSTPTPSGPQSGPANTGPGTAPQSAPAAQPLKFNQADIAWLADKIDPDMAAAMGFGNAGEARTGQTFWAHIEGWVKDELKREKGGGFFSHLFNPTKWSQIPKDLLNAAGAMKDAAGDFIKDPLGNFLDAAGKIIPAASLGILGGNAPGGGSQDWNMPTEFNTNDFRNFFLNSSDEMHRIYKPWSSGGPSAEAQVRFLDYMANVMQNVESGKLDPVTLKPTPGNEDTTGQSPAPFGETERDAFRRPLTQQEQNWFNYVQAATTGKVDVPERTQDSIQAQIDRDLATGVFRPVSEYVKQVHGAQTSNPGSYLYDTSRGVVPEGIAQSIQERVLQGMGNLGARYGSGTAGAVGAALKRVTDERALQAQQQIASAQQNVAYMEANREQAAQGALYASYLRNLGLPPEVAQLLNLVQINTGSSQNVKNPAASAGANWDTAGSILGGIGSLAGGLGGGGGGGSPFGGLFNTNAPVSSQTPTILPPDYYG